MIWVVALAFWACCMIVGLVLADWIAERAEEE